MGTRAPLDLSQIVTDIDATIAGYLAPSEALMLISLASQLPPNATVVELGSLIGKSTTLLGAGLLAGRGGRLFAVDLFGIPAGPSPAPDALARQPCVDNAYHMPELFCEHSQLELFQHHMVLFGLQNVVDTVIDDSVSAAKPFAAESVDLLFIDGGFEYDDVCNDLQEWLPRVKPDGIVACHYHNPDDYPAAVRAHDELLTRPKMDSHTLVRDLLICRKRAVGAAMPAARLSG